VSGLYLGRVLGIELRLHASVLIVFVLIVLQLGMGFLPGLHPDWGAAVVWGTAVAAAVIFLASILLHELSHAAVAKAYGMGVHSISLFLFGGVSNIEKEPPSPTAEFLMAVVGPLTSIGLGIAFLVVGAFAIGPMSPDADVLALAETLGPLGTLAMWLGPVNVALGVFNLLPAFPLDGGRMLRAVLWGATGQLVRATRWAAGLGQAGGMTLITFGVLMMFGVTIPFFGTGVGPGLWLGFLGFFLSQAATSSYTSTVVSEALTGVRAADVMSRRFQPVAAHGSVAGLVERMLEGDQMSFPVVDGERLVGVVTLEDVQKVDREDWPRTTVRAIMRSGDQLHHVSPATPAADVLRAFGRDGLDHVPVVEQGELRGVVRRQDVMRWLQIHGDLKV
jgi:Zn-dependent protease/CBS domain-containing protein